MLSRPSGVWPVVVALTLLASALWAAQTPPRSIEVAVVANAEAGGRTLFVSALMDNRVYRLSTSTSPVISSSSRSPMAGGLP
jgi:hypothetical protein